MKSVTLFLTFVASVLATNGPINQIPLAPSKPLTIDGIPLLGFGTWNLDKSNASEAVSWAIQTGYRHIDCAAIYGNEKEVGHGIADGLAKAGLQREDIWVTSKLWNDHHDSVELGINKTLLDLGLSYLDLYHMHWPVSDTHHKGHKIDYLATWQAMTALIPNGQTHHIGISNFSPAQLHNLLKHTTHRPSVHQMELHPYLQQYDWLATHADLGIHVTGYSPLAGSNPTYDPEGLVQLLENKVVRKIAEKRGCTPAQVVLKWGISRGTSVIPKSQRKDRIEENFFAPACELKEKDLKKLAKLGKARRRYNNPSEGWGVELYKDLEDSKGKGKKHS